MTTTTSLAIVLALLGGAIVLGHQTRLPPTQGEYGLSDAKLYQAIVKEGVLAPDILDGMSFEVAVNQDPRRIEAMLLQRVVQPLMLAVGKLANPTIPIGYVQAMTYRGYLEMMAARRARGPITSLVIASSMEVAWKAALEAMKSSGADPRLKPMLGAMQEAVVANKADIARAFKECDRILERAAEVSESEPTRDGYLQMKSTLGVMQLGLFMFLAASPPAAGSQRGEVIDADIGLDAFGADGSDSFFLGEVSSVPEEFVSGPELFGAEQMDDLSDIFNPAEFEQHIVTGHRAPSVALPQYRRMGGRFY